MYKSNSHKQIGLWLFICAFMIMIMVILGGYTRLTNSGLSIVEWRPITGIIPPLNLQAWMLEFQKYQTSPEYKYINFNITLEEFKQIFLIEYVHRLIGRVTGLIFIVPFLYFIVSKKINKQLFVQLLLILSLGLMQGVIGWYMVKSGLKDHYDVSHYRLALHLIMAVIILGLILWLGFNCYKNEIVSGKIYLAASVRHANFNIILILLQIISGAFVAGTNAGLIYNTFPLMGGKLIPSELFYMVPWYKNIFEDIVTIQLIHRALAMITMVSVIIFFLKNYKINLNKRGKRVILWLLIILITQIFLGISTLIYRVPTVLALLHQIGALLLFSVALYTSWLIRMQERYSYEL